MKDSVAEYAGLSKEAYEKLDRTPSPMDLNEMFDIPLEDVLDSCGWMFDEILVEAGICTVEERKKAEYDTVDLSLAVMDTAETLHTTDADRKVPTLYDVVEHQQIPVQEFLNLWDTWGEVLDASLSRNDRKPDNIPKEELILELRRVDTLVEGAVTQENIETHSVYSLSPFNGKWDSISEATKEAGIQTEARSKITKEELLTEVQQRYEELGRPVKTTDVERYSHSKYYDHWESWDQVLEAAGVPA